MTTTYDQLGDCGLTVSRVGLGCNSFGVTVAPDDVPAVVAAALDEGITLFDTADVYGSTPGESEELLGKALGRRCDDVVVATKFGMDARGLNGPDWGVRGSRRYVRRAVEGSLRRLGTDHVDLYQMHEPDPVTPLEETLDVLDDLVREGKVRYVGCSNFAAWQLVDAAWTARASGTTAFVSAQNRYSILDRRVEDELVPAAQQLGVGILPYQPLESGVLTGKYRRGEPAPDGTRLTRYPERLARADWDRVEALQRLADEWGVSLVDVALGGLVAQPGVSSVLVGASSPEQVRANVRSAGWEPDAAQLAAIEEASRG